MTAAAYPLEKSTRKTAVLTADGATSVFGPFSILIFDAADVVVWRKLPGETTFSKVAIGVTVSKTTTDAWAPFTVTFATTPATGTQFYCKGKRVPSRSSALTKASSTALSTDALDKELTQLAIVLQEMLRDLDELPEISVDAEAIFQAAAQAASAVALYRNAAYGAKGVVPNEKDGRPIMTLTSANMSIGARTFFGVQAPAYNPRTKRLMSLTLSGASTKDLSTINEHEFGDQVFNTPSLGASIEGKIIGHQGLAVQLDAADTWLWSTAYDETDTDGNPSPYTARQAVRAKYVSGAAMSSPQYFTLFGPEFSASISCSPAISPDQKYLIAQGQRTLGAAYNRVVRVWDLPACLASGETDWSDLFFAEHDVTGIADATHPVQGLQPDGAIFLITSGDATIAGTKRLWAFDLLTGEKLSISTDDMTLGKAQSALDGLGTRHEPEGICVVPNGAGGYTFLIGFVSGETSTGRFYRLYALGANVPVYARALNLLGNSLVAVSSTNSTGRSFGSLTIDGVNGLVAYGPNDSVRPNALGFRSNGTSTVYMTWKHDGVSGYWTSDTGDEYHDVPTSKAHIWRVNASEVARFSSTGAAIAAGRIQLGGSSAPLIIVGSGSPEGAVAAPVGSLYLRSDGGTSTTLYVKQSGSAGNTGWTAK